MTTPGSDSRMASPPPSGDEPKRIPPEVLEAINQGDYVVCYAKCWRCQFGQCTTEPHTWMDDEDIAHAGLKVPTTPAAWALLAAEKPCGCSCMSIHRSPAKSP